MKSGLNAKRAPALGARALLKVFSNNLFQNVSVYSRSRLEPILTAGILPVFRGLKLAPAAEIA
jgi:hypothetical protein